MSFEYSKCEPIENELAAKLEAEFDSDIDNCTKIEGWLELRLNTICSWMGIEEIAVTSMGGNPTYMGLYKDGTIYVDHAVLRTAKDYLEVGLHELAHHLNEKGGKEFTNEIEYNGKCYRLYHGDGFCKALITVYDIYQVIDKQVVAICSMLNK